MSIDPDRTPVIVAAGQAESRDHELGPIELLEQASREALGAAPGLAAAIERVTVVRVLTRRAGLSPASGLAKALGLRSPIPTETTSIGGNTPQAMVERAANDIAAGGLSATLIAGAEAVRMGRLRSGGGSEHSHRSEHSEPSQPAEPTEPDPIVGTDRQDLSDEERAAGIFIPVHAYPLFESVLAARAGRAPARQRAHLGELMAPFTEVAAQHPHAWFPERRTPRDLATPSDDNRLVVEPYTKRMVAFLGGAQSAALVVTSLSVARELGLADGAMFVYSAASASEVWYPVARPDLGAAAGLEAAAHATLCAAGVGIDDVELLDVYSCFPSAVQIGAEAIGAVSRLRPSEAGKLTVTGGLPYFGGPGNNYTAHAIATMLDRLRAAPPGSLALTTGVGWYLTKHSVGLYGNEPPPRGWQPPDRAQLAKEQERIDATTLPYVTDGTAPESAIATVEASTVFYDRTGRAEGAPVIASLEDGRRTAAAAHPDDLEQIAAEASQRWLVGSTISIGSGGGSGGSGEPPRYRLERIPTTTS